MYKSLLYCSILISTVLTASATAIDLKKLNVMTVRAQQHHIQSAITNRDMIKAIEAKKIIEPNTPVSIDENRHITVTPGIVLQPRDTTIFIFSRGYAMKDTLSDNYVGYTKNGGGLFGAWKYIRDHIITAPCVTFDYQDGPSDFNFAQEGDINNLKAVYEAVVATVPHARIILIGDCRGGLVILKFAATNPKNLSAIILESPFSSMHYLTERIVQSHWFLHWPTSRAIIYKFFSWYFSQFKPEQDHLFDLVDKIPDIPILIGHLKNDTLVSDSQMHELVHKLYETNHHHVYFSYLSDPTITHSRITKLPAFQKTTHAFLAHYDLPHNQPYAQQGVQLFDTALNNSKQVSVNSWSLAQ